MMAGIETSANFRRLTGCTFCSGDVQSDAPPPHQRRAAAAAFRRGGRSSMRRVVLLAALFGLLALALPASALAQVVAHISLSTQRMNVSIDGVPRFHWAVSTARPGYRTPTGTFKPTALFRYHASTIYSGSPMPYSIFFLRG